MQSCKKISHSIYGQNKQHQLMPPKRENDYIILSCVRPCQVYQGRFTLSHDQQRLKKVLTRFK